MRIQLDKLIIAIHARPSTGFSYEIKNYNVLEGIEYSRGYKKPKYAAVEQYILDLFKTTKLSVKTEDIDGQEYILSAKNIKIREGTHDIFIDVSTIEREQTIPTQYKYVCPGGPHQNIFECRGTHPSIEFYKFKDKLKTMTIFIKTITLTSRSADSIKAFVKRITDEYIKNQKIELLKTSTKYIFYIPAIYVYIYEGEKANILKTTKNFTNLFYHQKQKLLDKLDDFMNNKDKYKQMGIPHNLGILLSGEPGTGKTSTIKAIAAYTNRHIVRINMKNIDSIDKLFNLFKYSDVFWIDNIYDKVGKIIIVFEDIDCSDWADIIMSHKKENGLENNRIRQIIHNTRENTIKEIKEKIKSTVGIGWNMLKEEDKQSHLLAINRCVERNNNIPLTLTDLLDWVDGVIEYSGRIIIMTSNSHELLNESLLRPGRIDLHIELGKLMKADVNNFYRLWFDENIPEHIYANMMDKQFTQADIGLLFSEPDRNEIHKALTKS